MMGEHREQRLPENAAVRGLFGRVDTIGSRVGKIEETLKHIVTHKALLAYMGLALAGLVSAGWALFSAQKAELLEVKANSYRQEVKQDTLKDLIITGQIKAWPITPIPAPEVRAFIERASNAGPAASGGNP